jgi:hypothetical protein
MPVLDGLAATRAIRAGPAGTDTRILLVSATVVGGTPDRLAGGRRRRFPGQAPPPRRTPRTDRPNSCRCTTSTPPPSDAQPPTPPTFSPRAAAAALPAALRSELIDATEAGDVSRLRELVARQIAPRDRALSQILVELIAGFDYPGILELLRPSVP